MFSATRHRSLAILLFAAFALVLAIAFFVPGTASKPPAALTAQDFAQWIAPDMTFNDLTDTFGPPQQDIGSGIHIYVYTLTDSTQMRIGFTDRIVYVRQVDSDGSEIKQLL